MFSLIIKFSEGELDSLKMYVLVCGYVGRAFLDIVCKDVLWWFLGDLDCGIFSEENLICD